MYLFSGCRHWGQPTRTLPSEGALVFCFRKEGRSWHGQSCAQALASLLPTGSSLSSVAMILETTDMYITPEHHPSCSLRMCPSNPVVPAEGGWWHHPATEGTWPQRHVFACVFAKCCTSSCQGDGSDSTGVLWDGQSPETGYVLWTPAHTLLFWLSSLFPFSGCFFWRRMVSPVKE